MKNTPNAYDDLIAAGIEVESHESDLYCKATSRSREILDNHKCTYTEFFCESEWCMWIEAPFQFMPYWRERSKA